jgi:ribosomal protein S18 acetylase RimI-like enzyme
MEIRRIRADEGLAYREVRLRALKQAPDAYGTTFAEASTRTETEWTEFARRSAESETFALFVLDRGDGSLAGLAAISMEEGVPEEGTVFQMWIDEDLRGTEWGSGLLAAAERHGESLGARSITLSVEDDNPRARRFYDRAGYTLTGASEGNRRGGQTLEMRRWL